MNMNPAVVGAVLGGLGVALGAFGAHGLKGRLTADNLATYEVGVRYQLVHALALLAVGALLRHAPESAYWPTWLFLVGTIVFSGTLYALVLGAPGWIGAITPLGGLALIGGWITLALAVRSG